MARGHSRATGSVSGSSIDSAFLTDLNRFLNAANRVDGEFTKELRRAANKIADELAANVEQNAKGPYSEVWRNFHSRNDRYPVVELDARKVYRKSRARSRLTGKRRANSAKMSDIFFGAEYGSNEYHQFRPHGGREGFVLWPTVRRNRQKIAEDYLDAIDRVWNSLPGGK